MKRDLYKSQSSIYFLQATLDIFYALHSLLNFQATIRKRIAMESKKKKMELRAKI